MILGGLPSGHRVPDRLVRWDEPTAALQVIADVRDAMSAGRILGWRAETIPPAAAPLLWHLPPPSGVGQELRDWRARFRAGLCYYRRGPGFVQVKDVREPDDAAGIVLDQPAVLGVFSRCLRPTSLADLDPAEGDAAEALLAERLLLRIADEVLVLPYRMRRWPVPAMAL